MSLRVAVITATAVWLALAGSSAAQERVGILAGVSGDPNQFFFGGHFETAPLLDRLVFRPNAEIGIGDDLVLVGLNFEFGYKMPIQGQPVRAYFGAGPALNILSFDSDRRGRDDTETAGGFNILIGIEHQGGLFGELKVGAVDSPDLKFTVGYSFD